MKNKKRFLSFLLCFVFLFCVGCMDGGPSDFVGEDTPLSVQGVKVLSKPANYSFEEAVEGSSVNYYNIFANEILGNLYNIYENQTINNEELVENLLKDNGLTFNSWGDNDSNKYYLYDSLRYTITNIENRTDSSGNESQILTIDYDSAWNWTLPNMNTFFDNLVSPNFGLGVFENLNKTTLRIDNASLIEIYDLYSSQIGLPSFPDAYATESNKSLDNGATDFYYSPYYNAVKGVNEQMNNFFQDAFEYATYLFVLGYDYTKDASDAVLFDFELVFDDNTNYVKDILVGGWENQKISISRFTDENGNNLPTPALERVKKLYQEMGGYIGVTDTNKKQIIQFIKDKVIGKNAYDKNTFTITQITTQNGITTDTDTSLKFNRNYDQIIENIVNYAFVQATIGKDENGDDLRLNEYYLTSEITDYAGNFFGASYENNQDDNLFKYIPAAEYQSIVIYPNEEDIGKAIGDIWFAFEYWDDPRDTVTDKTQMANKVYADSITINVGFRYFDHEKGEFIADEQIQKKISYGQFPEYEDANGNKNSNFEEEYENHIASFSDTGTGTDKEIGEVVMKTKFKYDIGDNAINPFVSGTAIEGAGDEAKKITIKGANKAREYYTLNDSSSYGVFGTLDPTKFTGENGCDYIEIYFDIVKEKGKAGVNYNFKVALYNFLAAGNVY